MWPLGFWLPTTYAAAGTASAAIISILSKVGIYAVLRLWLLLFGEGAGDSAGFGGAWLFFGGLLTIAFGSVAVLATQNMARLAGASVLVSSGTLLAAIGTGQVAVTGGALFYLASSVLAIAAFFLLIELVERGREVGADVLAVTREAFGEGEEEELDEEEEIGLAIPATMAVLGMSFIGCALLLAGLPPLSGFLAKFAMLAPLLGSGDGVPCHRLGAARRPDPVRAGDGRRHDPRRHRRLLGVTGGRGAARAGDRDRPGHAAARPVPGADRRRRGRSCATWKPPPSRCTCRGTTSGACCRRRRRRSRSSEGGP